MWDNPPLPTAKLRFGFKGKDQLPLFMIWREWLDMGEVIHADVLFTTFYLRQAWWWRGIVRNLVSI